MATEPLSPAQEALIKAWPAVVLAGLGALWPAVKAWRARQVKSAKLRAVEGKAVRYLLDAQRHSLRVIAPSEGGRTWLVDLDEIIRQKALIDDVREELWVADGHASRRDTEQTVAEVVKVMTRTQAIRARTEGRPDGRGDEG